MAKGWTSAAKKALAREFLLGDNNTKVVMMLLSKTLVRDVAGKVANCIKKGSENEVLIFVFYEANGNGKWWIDRACACANVEFGLRTVVDLLCGVGYSCVGVLFVLYSIHRLRHTSEFLVCYYWAAG